VNRSRRKGLIEKVFAALTGVLPYRCLECEMRFFANTIPEQDQFSTQDRAAA
jgi:hypothetical protein